MRNRHRRCCHRAVVDVGARRGKPAVSAANAAGAPGVPDADFVVASAAELKDWRAAPAPPGNARHAGRKPIFTFGLAGLGLSGAPCEVGSVFRAAGPGGMSRLWRGSLLKATP